MDNKVDGQTVDWRELEYLTGEARGSRSEWEPRAEGFRKNQDQDAELRRCYCQNKNNKK
jgi:hypothetical protein